MSSINLEGLEFKEATPSIAPSIYESLQYTKKWRILLAIGIGVCLIVVCMLIFYVSAEAKRPKYDELSLKEDLAILKNDDVRNAWRTTANGECFAFSQPSCPEDFGDIPLFLLVLGGLRTDQTSEIPAVSELMKCGAKANSLVPTYPSFNYPNLYSIATGLFSESHGVLSSKELVGDFSGSNSTPPPRGEPLWDTLERHGKISASYNWPGSSSRLQNNATNEESKTLNFLSQIKEVVDWLKLPVNERPRLIMMHYEEPGVTSQNFGPFSPQTTLELAKINSGLDELMTSLQSLNMFNCLNILVVSDHGVAASLCENSIYIDNILSKDVPGRIYASSVGRIVFNNDTTQETVNKITKEIQCKDPALRVLSKNQVPKRYHYTKDSNIGELILDTKSGHRIVTGADDGCLVGQFGFDILSRSMQGVFVGFGPSFKIGYITPSFRNVEIYNLVTHIINIQPAPNNGTKGSLIHLLKRSYGRRKDYEVIPKQYLKTVDKPLPERPNNSILGHTTDAKNKKLDECSCEFAPDSVTEEPVTSALSTSASLPSTSTSKATLISSITTEAPTTVPNRNEEFSSSPSVVVSSSAPSAENTTYDGIVDQRESHALNTSVLFQTTLVPILNPKEMLNESTSRSVVKKTEEIMTNSALQYNTSTKTVDTLASLASSVSEKSTVETETNSYTGISTSTVQTSAIDTTANLSVQSLNKNIKTQMSPTMLTTINTVVITRATVLTSDSTTPSPSISSPSKITESSIASSDSQNKDINIYVGNNKENNTTEKNQVEILPIPASLKSLSLTKENNEQEYLSNAELQTLHCPWGVPAFSAPEVASDILNVLHHSSHIIGFPESLNIGIWTSFTITRKKLDKIKKFRPPVPEGIFISPEERQKDLPVGCWMSDSRLQRSSGDQCSRIFQTDLFNSQNVSLRQLYPEELEIPDILSREGFLLSNLAPMRKGYEMGPRRAMLEAIEKWAEERGPINIVHGPVFDYDLDGKKDDVISIRNTIKPLIPSDYFFVITFCNESKQSNESEHRKVSLELCPFSNFRVYSFVFPNTEENDMCHMTDREYLQYHLASLADVEDLTSLRMFETLPDSEHSQLRAQQSLRILSY